MNPDLSHVGMSCRFSQNIIISGLQNCILILLQLQVSHADLVTAKPYDLPPHTRPESSPVDLGLPPHPLHVSLQPWFQALKHFQQVPATSDTVSYR